MNTDADSTGATSQFVPGEKCPLSGVVISWEREAWINEFGRCWGCGGMTRLKVRITDLSPWGRALTHKVPATPTADR